MCYRYDAGLSSSVGSFRMEKKLDSHQHVKQKYRSALSARVMHLDNHRQTSMAKVNWDGFLFLKVENVTLLWHFSSFCLFVCVYVCVLLFDCCFASCERMPCSKQKAHTESLIKMRGWIKKKQKEKQNGPCR